MGVGEVMTAIQPTLSENQGIIYMIISVSTFQTPKPTTQKAWQILLNTRLMVNYILTETNELTSRSEPLFWQLK